LRLQSAKPRLPGQEVTKQAVRILEAAKIVFLRDGGAKFSARGVAKQAQVGLSTVQHFFPTTDELQLAMLEYVERVYYQDVFREMGAKLPFLGPARLRGMLDYLLDGLFKPTTRSFYFGFWSLSCHNKRVEKFLTECYSHYRDNLAILIGAANPALSEELCHDLATHIAAMIEGLLIFIVPKGKRFANRKKIAQSIKQSIWTLIFAEQVRDR
jgi:AcrR family transcriptional regulator